MVRFKISQATPTCDVVPTIQDMYEGDEVVITNQSDLVFKGVKNENITGNFSISSEVVYPENSTNTLETIDVTFTFTPSSDFSKNYTELGEAEKAEWDAHAEKFTEAVNNDVPVKIQFDTLLSYRTKYLNSHGVDLFATDGEYKLLSEDQKAKWLEAYEACSAELKVEYGENAFLLKPISYVLAYEEKYEVDLTLSAIDRANFTKDQLKDWNKAFEKCEKALANDIAYNARMMRILGFTLMMVSIGVLLSMLVLEFTLPLVFKNGSTIGKKVFGIGLVHQNGVRVNTITMFIRTFLGKYAVETMVPVLLVLMLFTGNGIISIIVMALILVLEIVLFVWKKDTRPFIHDVFAKTVVVDLASQMIFQNEVEMQEYRRSAYAEASADSEADKLYSTANPLSSSFVEIKKDDKDSDKTE